MEHINNPRLILSALGLLSTIAGGVLADFVDPSPPATQAATVFAPVPVVATPSPLAYAVPGEQQAFVWGYTYSQNLVPDLSWMQLEQGIQYRLFDEGHTCIGIVTADGEPKLIHWFPDICSPAPAANPEGEVTAHG